MALGFSKQTNKNAQATSSTTRRRGRQKDMRPPSLRSPALESVERQGGRAATGKRLPASIGKVRYAAEEKLALVQAMFGENSRAISTLRRLLDIPFQSQLYGPAPLTPAFLTLDPLWDSLRTVPAFRELCDEKQL